MTTKEISPIGNFSFSYFNQMNNQYQEHMDRQQKVPEREYQRMNWLHIIAQKEKIIGMGKVIDHLKTKNLIQKHRLIQLHLFFNRYYKMTVRRKWQRLKQKLIIRECNKKFADKTKRVCEVRSRQAMNYIGEETHFATPDLSFLVKQTYQLESLYALRGNGKILTKPESIPKYRRKDAMILYLWVIVLSILIGLLIFKWSHFDLYHYLNLNNLLKNGKVNQTQKFTYPKSADQADVIKNVLNIV